MPNIQLIKYSLLIYFLGMPLTFAATDAALEHTIQTVSYAFKTQDAHTIQKYIHPKYGFIYWNKIGVPTNQSFYTQAEFVFPKYENNGSNMWFYEAPEAGQKLIKTTQLPTMNCTSWNKSGLFYRVSTQKPFSTLSQNNQNIIGSSEQEVKADLKKSPLLKNNWLNCNMSVAVKVLTMTCTYFLVKLMENGTFQHSIMQESVMLKC